MASLESLELPDVLALCIAANSAFVDYKENCRRLTPFVHEFRYPGEATEPDPKRTAEALRLAEDVYLFCKQQLGAT
jgi:hypothetical protein